MATANNLRHAPRRRRCTQAAGSSANGGRGHQRSLPSSFPSSSLASAPSDPINKPKNKQERCKGCKEKTPFKCCEKPLCWSRGNPDSCFMRHLKEEHSACESHFLSTKVTDDSNHANRKDCACGAQCGKGGHVLEASAKDQTRPSRECKCGARLRPNPYCFIRHLKRVESINI